MHEAVSDILVERARGNDGMSRMVTLSLSAHAGLIAVLILMPASWRSATVPVEATPMMITLGGGSAPDAGGLTPIAARPVEVAAPADAKPKVEAPAPKIPEMVAPTPAPKVVPKPIPPKPIDKRVDSASSRNPTTGPQPKVGDARVATDGAAIPFGGLTRPSGRGTSASATTDYANFCCPTYLNEMTDLIKRNWNENQGASGQVQVKFTIRRDGTVADVKVEKPSGADMLDLESQRAILKTRQLPPLPREFTEPTLTVHLVFEYHR
ncbi:MAG: TonB family protein [Acidobacteriota bacterium]